MWLVETKVFPKIKKIFLVKGRTKNACNRLFKLVKLDYHRKFVYTYNELFETIDGNEFITMYKIQPQDFYNFNAWQDKCYRTLSTGEFNTTHIFTISSNNGNSLMVMVKQDVYGAIESQSEMLPNTRSCKAKVLSPSERATALKK